MTVTLTNRLLLSKPDAAELVAIALLNANFDEIDDNFIPAAMMVASSNQSINNNSVTTVAYDVTNYDSYAARSEGAMVNLSTDTITIRKAGLYDVISGGAFAPNATGIRRLEIAKNGASFNIDQESNVSAGGSQSLFVSEPVVLAVNDAITARCFQTSGGALNYTNVGFADAAFLAVIWRGSIS